MKKMTVEDRLIVIETLLGLRELDKPELERLRFEQAAYAGRLLNFASSSFGSYAFWDDFSASYVRARLAQIGLKKPNPEPCDCEHCQEKPE